MPNKLGFFKRLKELKLAQKKLFAIALCQRMLPNYQLFSAVCHFGDPQVLDTVLKLLWQSMYDKQLKLNLALHIERLTQNTPEPNNFDVYGVYPAMDASVALIALLSALQSKVEDDIINISKLSSSTVANYIETINEQPIAEDLLDDFIFNHEAMLEEKALQLKLLELIEATPTITAPMVKSLQKNLVQEGISNIGISTDDI